MTLSGNRDVCMCVCILCAPAAQNRNCTGDNPIRVLESLDNSVISDQSFLFIGDQLPHEPVETMAAQLHFLTCELGVRRRRF